MVNYTRCSLAQLQRFVRDRGLQVPPVGTGRLSNRALKHEFTQTLQDADASLTFRFLDLPPELRNLMYRELLDIKEVSSSRKSPKCYPQILRTSKEINQEANSILYGDNTIDVKVYSGGVYAHGLRCGTYEPGTDVRTGHARLSEQIVWPAFLLRARGVRLVIVDMQAGPANYQEPPNLGTLHNILFSLCAFLQQSTSLKSVVVDFTWLTKRLIQMGRLHDFTDCLLVAVYPLRMMDQRDRVRIEVVDLSCRDR